MNIWAGAIGLFLPHIWREVSVQGWGTGRRSEERGFELVILPGYWNSTFLWLRELDRVQIRTLCSDFSPSGPWLSEGCFLIILLPACASSLNSWAISTWGQFRLSDFSSTYWTLLSPRLTGYFPFILSNMRSYLCRCVFIGCGIPVSRNCLGLPWRPKW